METSKNIVITGSRKGIGLAFAYEFLKFGDNVVISSRTEDKLRTMVDALSLEFGDAVVGFPCDVKKINQIEKLVDFAIDQFGSIDIWINNAGIVTNERKKFHNVDINETRDIVDTNLIGTLNCCNIVINRLIETGVHIFNMAGMGSDGRVSATGLTSYGTSKRAIPYIAKSLTEEYKDTKIKVSTISPGMVMTDLIINARTIESYQIFNILAEEAETVAKELAPKIRSSTTSNDYIKYLTRWKVMYRFLTAYWRKHRFYDEEGNLQITKIEDKILSNLD